MQSSLLWTLWNRTAVSCLQKICTIRSQTLSACLGSLTSSLFALYGLNKRQILKLDGIYSENVLHWEMWLMSKNGEELCEEGWFGAERRKDFKNINNIFLFLEDILHFGLIEFFLDSKHTELLEKLCLLQKCWGSAHTAGSEINRLRRNLKWMQPTIHSDDITVTF